MKVFGEAARAVWSRKELWVVQAAGNLAALAMAWVWFSLPDAEVWQVAVSAVLGLCGVCLLVWLHGATLAACRRQAGVPWRATVKRLPALLAWPAALAGALWAVFRWIPPQRLVWREAAVAVAAWLFVPLASQLAADGFRGKGAGRCLLSWRYLLGFAAAAMLGVCLPVRLVWWAPEVEGIVWQAASMGARFLLAYLLAVASWLLLASLVGRLSSDSIGRQS